MASEVGVVKEPPENVVHKGRLQPGRIFLIDFNEGRMISDGELKSKITGGQPYSHWLENNRLKLNDLPDGTAAKLEHDLTTL